MNDRSTHTFGTPVIRETDRLVLRRLSEDDAEFIVRLLNTPGWLRFIGDRGVRSTQDALRYLRTGPLRMYADCGFGLYRVEKKEGPEPIGLCGILQREGLAHPDLGFAFLPHASGHGYAKEAAQATLHHAQHDLGLTTILAITSPDNAASIGLLTGLDFVSEGSTTLTSGAAVLNLYRWAEP